MHIYIFVRMLIVFFFFNDTATTEIYTLSLHDALPIAIGNPADGYYAAQVVRDSGGWGESASDREIVDAIKLLAKTEGIWTEPAGGTTLAATIKLIEQGRIPRNESIVVSITGNGLKTQEVVVDELTPPRVIEAKLTEFDQLLAENQATIKREA